MALPEFTIRQLLEAGVHFGHRKHLWNPKMAPYIYGTRNNLHIIDLSQTAPLLYQALQSISETIANGGRVLMVGTKYQAQESIAAAAKQSAQYFVNARWLGGMLTNWDTVSQAIQRLRNMEEILAGDTTGHTKKEILNLTRERDKLERNLGGIKDMGGVPDMLFVIDSNREAIAIKEAARLNIPVAAILDSNSNPDGITYPIPGNDDAARSINLYCDLVAQAAIDGLSRAKVRPVEDTEAADGPAGNTKTAEVKSKEGDSPKAKRSRRSRGKSSKSGKDSEVGKPKSKGQPDKDAGKDNEKSKKPAAKKKSAARKKDAKESASDEKSETAVKTSSKSADAKSKTEPVKAKKDKAKSAQKTSKPKEAPAKGSAKSAETKTDKSKSAEKEAESKTEAKAKESESADKKAE